MHARVELTPVNDAPGAHRLQKLLCFSWQVSLGESMSVSVEEFRRLVASGDRVVKFKDRYVVLDQATVAAVLKQASTPPPKHTAADVVRMSLAVRCDHLGDWPGARLISRHGDVFA